MTPISIAVAVVERDGMFLVGTRAEGSALAGYDEFPGGKVHDGETPEQAAARECLEETGMAVVIGEAYPEVVHQYDHARVRLHFFAARPVDAKAEPRPPFRWIARGDLGTLRFPEANAALLAVLGNDKC